MIIHSGNTIFAPFYCALKYIHMCVCVCVCVYTHTHTYIYMHLHADVGFYLSQLIIYHQTFKIKLLNTS